MENIKSEYLNTINQPKLYTRPIINQSFFLRGKNFIASPKRQLTNIEAIIKTMYKGVSNAP